jgi:superfamily II RNA helicase
MAGRAGRRGIDTVGHVIHLPLLYRRGIPTELEYKDILSNKPQTLVSKFHIDYKMILSLLKKGVSADFHLFAEKSMSKNTIVKEVRYQEFELDKLQKECEHLQGCLKTIRTPLDTCKEYNVLLEQYRTSTNKKRKEIERKMTAIKDHHKYIGEDIRLLAKVETLELSIQKKDREIEATNSYLKRQTDLVCRILVELDVLTRVTDQERELDQIYTLSHPLGIAAAQFAEVHPYPLAELILNNNWFNGWTAKQLVGLLSVFVDIRLPEHQREIEPQCVDPRVKRAITALQKSYDDIRQMELDYECYTGIRYEGMLCFDMADAMMNWCDLTETENETKKENGGDGGEDSNTNTNKCKLYLQDLVAGSVSSGDFAKACMKLSATAKEMIAMCESVVPFVTGSGPTELAHTLTQIDAMLLKHIATTQSLYL